MASLPPALSIDVDSVRRYDGWRRQWCIGGRSQAIGLLCHHGMARALTLTAPPGPPAAVPTSVASSRDPLPVSECTAVTGAAARMIHELLVHEAGEGRHA